MAAQTLVSVEEYLRASSKPACEYIDGVLHQKTMPTFLHSLMQSRLVSLLLRVAPGFNVLPELTVQVRPDKFLIPDVAVQRAEDRQEPYPTKPVYLCVEILSPQDRYGEAFTKCEDYHAWGVQFCWVIDPEKRLCWEYAAGDRPNPISAGGRLTAGEIAIDVNDLFEGL
jgi:Uma2 family endonuclease